MYQEVLDANPRLTANSIYTGVGINGLVYQEVLDPNPRLTANSIYTGVGVQWLGVPGGAGS